MALRAALADLLPSSWSSLPDVPSVHEGEVRGARPTLPWVVWSVSVPDGAFRGEGAVPTAHRVVLSVTVAGRTEAEAGLLLREVGRAVDGARPVVAGWSCGALVAHQPPRTWPDDIDLAGASARAFVGVASWRLVASALPTP